jgi:hypothetical protein
MLVSRPTWLVVADELLQAVAAGDEPRAGRMQSGMGAKLLLASQDITGLDTVQRFKPWPWRTS